MYEQARFLPMGDCALVMEFANEISKEVNARIRQTTKAIEKIEGVIEVLPTYRSITIFYRPDQIAYDELVTKLQTIKEGNEEGDSLSRRIEIPTVYGGEYGPDLAYVAQHASLSEEEVIRIHTGTDYLVYMLGFSPGFTYLRSRQRICQLLLGDTLRRDKIDHSSQRTILYHKIKRAAQIMHADPRKTLLAIAYHHTYPGETLQLKHLSQCPAILREYDPEPGNHKPHIRQTRPRFLFPCAT